MTPHLLKMRSLVGTHDIALITLDTLRYDVARESMDTGRTPHFERLFAGAGWERRHTPASFTYAAHQAFFAGFFPTPAGSGPSARPFALRFAGSATSSEDTCVLDGPDIVAGLRALGYFALCIGGTGFFSKENALGNVLPALFDESHWERRFGVRDPRSTEYQVARAIQTLEDRPASQRVFLFLNVSAIHQPNRHYLPGSERDSLTSHAKALEYVDGALAPLFAAFRRRAPTACFVFSDHGEAYGDDGYWGHRVGHPSVWDVPYAEFVVS
jgi:hypothetical protein